MDTSRIMKHFDSNLTGKSNVEKENMQTLKSQKELGVSAVSLASPLDEQQIDELLNRVNMNSTFLSLATNDQSLINMLKETILY